jgi:hypothetical protein
MRRLSPLRSLTVQLECVSQSALLHEQDSRLLSPSLTERIALHVTRLLNAI